MRIRFAMTWIVWVACAAVALSAAQTANQNAPNGASKKPVASPDADLSKLPSAVRRTIEAETRNATVKNVAKEREKGQEQYEVETVVNGRSRDLLIDLSGRVLEVEESIPLESAPAPVQEALKAKGKVLRVESVLRDGKTTFEAQVQGKNGKKSEVALDAQGKALKR
jgi:uncharacterized membrane protein YkoI